MCTRIFACSFAVLAAAVTADDDVAIGSLPPTMSCILGNGISPLNRFSCGQRLDVVANAVAGTTGMYPSADNFRLTRESSLSSITEDGKLRGNGNTVSLYSNSSSLFLFYFYFIFILFFKVVPVRLILEDAVSFFLFSSSFLSYTILINGRPASDDRR